MRSQQPEIQSFDFWALETLDAFVSVLASEMQHARAAEPPKDNSQYLSADYWNARFGRESSHEWLRSYQDFRQLLRVHLKASDRILIVGNGTSALPLDLAADGFVHVTATDLSPAAIQGMQRRQAEASRSDVQWQVLYCSSQLPSLQSSHDSSPGTQLYEYPAVYATPAERHHAGC